MAGFLGNMFDINRDGNLDSFERGKWMCRGATKTWNLWVEPFMLWSGNGEPSIRDIFEGDGAWKGSRTDGA